MKGVQHRLDTNEAVSVFPSAIKLAGILFLISAAAIGWQSSTVLQVGVLSALHSTKDVVVAAMPEFLVGKKYGLDIPVPFLYDGEVVGAIVAETIAFRDIEEKVKPSKRIIEQMEALSKSYANVLSDLETTTTILLAEIHHTAWATLFAKQLKARIELAINRTLPSRYHKYFVPYVSARSERWIAGNKSLAATLQETDTALATGDIITVLQAFTQSYPTIEPQMSSIYSQLERLNDAIQAKIEADEFSLKIRIMNSEIKLGMKPTDYVADFAATETALRSWIHGFLPENLVEYTINVMKIRVLIPRLKSIEDGIVAEKGRELYQAFAKTMDELKLLEDSVMKTAKLFTSACQTNSAPNPQCTIAGKLDTDLNRMLMELQTRGFRYPKTILQTILKSSRQYVRTELSIRELNHRMKVEEFKQSPNMWLNLAALSASIGLATFVACLAYQAAWILNYGFIGTLCNVVGIVYDVSVSARSMSQAQAEALQSRLRIDGHESREIEARASIRSLGALREALHESNEARALVNSRMLLTDNLHSTK